MLMRYSKLARDGTFTKPLHEKVSYGTMLYVRAFLIWSCRDALARGCTIAVRYSCVRRQFAAQGAAPGAEELKVMDYLHQQHSLLTLLSTAYAFHFSAEAIQKLYWSMIKGLQAEDASALQETHVTCSGLKALCTELTANGLEECRRRCGGHGLSMLAGIPLIFADIAPSTTYEGDNKVLLLQVARFLLKQTRVSCARCDAAASPLPPCHTLTTTRPLPVPTLCACCRTPRAASRSRASASTWATRSAPAVCAAKLIFWNLPRSCCSSVSARAA
jgi:acyl-CoA oxidase